MALKSPAAARTAHLGHNVSQHATRLHRRLPQGASETSACRHSGSTVARMLALMGPTEATPTEQVDVLGPFQDHTLTAGRRAALLPLAGHSGRTIA